MGCSRSYGITFMRSCVGATAAARIFGTRPFGIGSHNASFEQAKHLPLPDPPLQPAVITLANVHGTVSGMGNVLGSSPWLMTNNVWKALFTSWSEVMEPAGMETSFSFVPAGRLAAHVGVGWRRVTPARDCASVDGCPGGGGGGATGGGPGGVCPNARAAASRMESAVKGTTSFGPNRVFFSAAVGDGPPAVGDGPPAGGVIELRNVFVIAAAVGVGAADDEAPGCAVAAGAAAVGAAANWRAAVACASARAFFACASWSAPAFPDAVIAASAACACARRGATDDATRPWTMPGAQDFKRLPMVDTIVMCVICPTTDPTMPVRSSAAVLPRMRFVITACVNSATNIETANNRCSKGNDCTWPASGREEGTFD